MTGDALSEILFEHFLLTVSDETIMECLGHYVWNNSGLGVFKTGGSWAWYDDTETAGQWLERQLAAYDAVIDSGTHEDFARRLDQAIRFSAILSKFGHDEDGALLVSRCQR